MSARYSITRSGSVDVGAKDYASTVAYGAADGTLRESWTLYPVRHASDNYAGSFEAETREVWGVQTVDPVGTVYPSRDGNYYTLTRHFGSGSA